MFALRTWAYVCLSAVLYVGVAARAQAARPSGFASVPIFDEEFNGSSLDTSRWQYRNLGPRGLAIQTQDAVRVHDGHLTITTYSAKDERGAQRIYSGMISTGPFFRQTYGYWEASLRCNYVSGMQPAFWLQSDTIGQPIGDAASAGVEMDIYEHVSGEANSRAFDHAFHWDGYAKDHKSVARFFTRNHLDDGNFHTFGIAWTPDGYKLYVDGTLNLTLSRAEVPVSEHPESIILSTEVYRATPSAGYDDLQHSRATFDVDYVRVYPMLPDSKHP